MDMLNRSTESATTRLFQEPYNNNFVEVYLKHHTDRVLYNCQLRALYKELNAADFELFKYLQDINNKRYKIDSVSQTLATWEYYLCNNKNLVGVFYLRSVIAFYTAEGIDIVRVISMERPEIINDFILLPKTVKNPIRINMCIGFTQCKSFLNKLAATIFCQSKFFDLIDRIEIAKPRTDIFPDFPTIILYLDLAAVHKKTGLTIALFKALNALYENLNYQHPIRHDYADPWNEFVNLSQGFKLYKVYLTLLGVLDDVYDPHTNYAYLLKSQEGNLLNVAKQRLSGM